MTPGLPGLTLPGGEKYALARVCNGKVVGEEIVSEFDEKTRVTAVVPAPSSRRRGSDCLVVIYSKDPVLLGKRFVLEQGPLRVGRGSDNQIILDGDSVSRRHAHWERRGEVWWVVDDGSTNGTYVNDELIARQHALQNGDRVKIGGVIFKYLSGEDVESQYHEEIYKMTIIDGLVQIYNKRFLYEALDREITRARRHTREMCVVMFDIDHFKRINDQFGHLAGDYVLKELAKVVQTRIRRDEIFARYGGEEFALVLPETTLAGARTLCESIRERVAQYRFVFQSELMPVTISIGATLLLDTDRGANDVIARADEKLYEAKRGGRNRVCVLNRPNIRPARGHGGASIGGHERYPAQGVRRLSRVRQPVHRQPGLAGPRARADHPGRGGEALRPRRQGF